MSWRLRSKVRCCKLAETEQVLNQQDQIVHCFSLHLTACWTSAKNRICHESAGLGHTGHTLRQRKISQSLRCKSILLKRMRHYATVEFNNERGRRTCRRALESGNRETKQLSLCMCAPLHMWAHLQVEKGIQEKRVQRRWQDYRNTHLWHHKKRTKIFTLNEITVWPLTWSKILNIAGKIRLQF